MSDLLNELGQSENSEEFEDAWAAKFGGPVEDTQPDTEVVETPAEETVETPEGQPRDEQGRFARVDTPSVDEHTAETELEREEEQQVEARAADPVESYLAKYGGDVAAALKGAAEAQKLIGRRDEEKDDLRARLDRLEQERQVQAASPQVARAITESDVERLDELALSNGQRALEEALRLDPSGQLGQRVFDTWSSVAPGAASLYAADKIAEQRINAFKAELEPVLEANRTTQQDRDFVDMWGKLAASRPEVEQLVPAMSQILDERPDLARAIYEAQPAQQVVLLETLADAASARQQPAVQEAIAQYEAERSEASRASRVAATVTAPKGAIGSPPGGATAAEKTQAQKEGDAIRAKILETPDTSILSGWTTE